MEDYNNVTVTKDSFWDFKGEFDFVDKWFLMGSPLPIMIIVLSYLLFVLKLGPMFMKHKEPYKLNNVLLVYNAAQVLISLTVFRIGILITLEHALFERDCSMHKEDFQRTITYATYVYFFAKLSELNDTIFFVLRKKSNQITFLHVYHHAFMFVAAWVTLKYEPSHTIVFIGTINSLVHVVMYTYYGMAAFPGLTKYLWWKKYITKMQLIQFFMILIHVTVNYNTSKCRSSYIQLTMCWTHVSLFIYLFSEFYIKSYTNKVKETAPVKNNVGSNIGPKGGDIVDKNCAVNYTNGAKPSKGINNRKIAEKSR